MDTTKLKWCDNVHDRIVPKLRDQTWLERAAAGLAEVLSYLIIFGPPLHYLFGPFSFAAFVHGLFVACPLLLICNIDFVFAIPGLSSLKFLLGSFGNTVGLRAPGWFFLAIGMRSFPAFTWAVFLLVGGRLQLRAVLCALVWGLSLAGLVIFFAVLWWWKFLKFSLRMLWRFSALVTLYCYHPRGLVLDIYTSVAVMEILTIIPIFSVTAFLALTLDFAFCGHFLMFGFWPTGNIWYARLQKRRPGLLRRTGKRMFFAHTKVLVTKISKVRLHELVYHSYSAPSLTTINKGLQLMKELGWPVDDHVAPLSDNPFAFGRTRFSPGVVRTKAVIFDTLVEMRRQYGVVSHVFTGTYASTDNEYKSIERYFHGDNKEWDPTGLLQDMWYLTSPLYANAILTPTKRVINSFVKKYSLGFGMIEGAGRKIKRSAFIRQVGYKNFRIMWDDLARHFAGIVPVTHVSVKQEYLKPAKFLLDKVRAICGAPLSHYAATRNIRYEQNHRSKPDTGIVVGMPLTGYYFAKLVSKHMLMDVHEAGDFSDFDSTLNQKLNELEGKLSLKGFEGHDQYDLIATILDLQTKQLDSMPLWMQSTGEVFAKPTGLTTGHGETTRKNSVALVALYLTAWKDLTGLSAVEFKRYNVLSNFGDDHILSYSRDAPAAWNFKNVQVALRKYGVGLKDENEALKASGKATGSVFDLEFLSKCFRRATTEDQMLMKRLGIQSSCVVYHNKEKLLGKLLADPKSADPSYLLKRYYGYIQLCAHHPDVYDSCTKLIMELRAKHPKILCKPIPSYDSLMRAWYSPSARLQAIEDDDEFETEAAVRSVSPNWAGILFDWLSASTDVLSYRMLSAGPWRMAQKAFMTRLAWPVQLIRSRNPEIASVVALDRVMSRTPYSFLDADVFTDYCCPDDKTSVRARHHLFMLYYLFRGPRRTTIGWTDVINALTKRVGDFQFAVNGRVADAVVWKDNDWLDFAVVYALSFLEVPGYLLMDFELPSPSVFLDRMLYVARGELINRVPCVYDDLEPWLGGFTPGSIVVSAPTGTGKSTRMIDWLADKAPEKHVVVVEPRQLLVEQLSGFVGSFSQHSVSSAYHGVETNRKARIIYATAQSLFARGLLSTDNLYVVDEAHFSEPLYAGLKKFFLANKQYRVLFVTATPPKDLAHLPQVCIRTQRAWDLQVRTTEAKSVEDFMKATLSKIQGSDPTAKHLIFLPARRQADNFARMLGPSLCCLISSRNKVIDPHAKYYISTKVSDAGLTIPDVEFVHTGSVDVTVLDNKPVWYNIDELTLTQRSGRTGRTCDGVVFRCNIGGCQDLPSYTATQRLTDYAAALKNNVFLDFVCATEQDSRAFLLAEGFAVDVNNNFTLSVKGKKWIDESMRRIS